MNTKFVTEVAIFVALGLILDYISGLLGVAVWANGGSVSLGMLPVFIMAFRHGIKGGLLTGFLVGLIQILFASSGYLLHPIQVALDYYVAYMVVGFAGIFAAKVKENGPRYILLGVLVGGGLRLVSHLLAGYVWWNTWAPEGMNITLYVFLYNASYMIPSMIVCYFILVPTYKRLKF